MYSEGALQHLNKVNQKYLTSPQDLIVRAKDFSRIPSEPEQEKWRVIVLPW